MLTLPIFPLHAVLFPGMPLYLHIFEPRYRSMINHCLEKDLPFGVSLIHEGTEAYGPPAKPRKFGCSVRISQVERLKDGCMNITVIGEDRFRIVDLDTSLPYLMGQVETLSLPNPRPLEVLRSIASLRLQVRVYLNYLTRINTEDLDLQKIELPTDMQSLLYMAASLLQLPTTEKQTLLESETASSLLWQLQRLYRREIAMMNPIEFAGEERARKSSWLN